MSLRTRYLYTQPFEACSLITAFAVLPLACASQPMPSVCILIASIWMSRWLIASADIMQVYIVSEADGFHISGTDSVLIIDIEALGEPTPCMYDETTRQDWWTDYRAGNMAVYPYARRFLRDESAPLAP